MQDGIPDEYRAAIVTAFPDLWAAKLTLLNGGWDSIAIDADDRLIFKFPRHATAEASLRREAKLLAFLGSRLTLSVPALTIYETPFCFSSHVKLKGEHLLAADYALLPDAARARLAETLGRFYAELHAVPRETMASLGAKTIVAWLAPDVIASRTSSLLTGKALAFMVETIDAWRAAPADPFGETYGFFDGHGWNMAFNHETQTLSGIYDFADSGFGPLSQDFIYSDFISTDLTDRIVGAYATLTGRYVDLDRVRMLSGVLRLTELAQYADDPENRPTMLAALETWIGR